MADVVANAHLTPPLKMLPTPELMVTDWSAGPTSMNHQGGRHITTGDRTFSPQGGPHPPNVSITPIMNIIILGSTDRKTHKNFDFWFVLICFIDLLSWSKWEGHTLDKTWIQDKNEESQCIVLHHTFTCSKFSQLKSHIHFGKNSWLKLARNETLNFVVDVSVY